MTHRTKQMTLHKLTFAGLAPLFLVLLASCSASRPADPVLPHDSFTLQSAAVGELRRINVYTPPGYEQGQKTYPVLYMPDGGVKEDFSAHQQHHRQADS